MQVEPESPKNSLEISNFQGVLEVESIFQGILVGSIHFRNF